jgi:hypothetical protein
MSAPVFAFFLLFSFKAAGEPNWPVTAYVSGMVLAAAWLAPPLRSPSAGHRRLARASLAAACALGLGLTVLMHHSEWARPVLARLAGPAGPERPLPLRRLDPTCRLRGWRALAAEVDRTRERLRQEGVEPVLAGTAWTLPGELAFYCRGHPTVYCLGPAMGDRHSQYDLWRPNPVLDPERFVGATMLVVGDIPPSARRAFRAVETSWTVTYEENGRPLARWTLTLCRGFRGFAQRPLAHRW